MLVSQAIKHYGSQSALARALRISQPAVAMWIQRGLKRVPELQARRLHQLTRGKLKFDAEDYTG